MPYQDFKNTPGVTVIESPTQTSVSSNRVTSDFDYENYLDPDLYSLFQNNPYANLYYSPTFWDDIGLSNKAKDTNLTYQKAYNEYVSKLMELQSERNFNSPANQAQLERQAGLNPDLTGISGTALNDIPNSEAQNPASLDGRSPVIEPLSHFASILSFALNAYTGIKSTIANVKSIDLSNTEKLKNLAMPYVSDSFTSIHMNPDDVNPNESFNISRNRFNSFLPRHSKKQGIKAFDSLISSFDSYYQGADKFNRYFDANFSADMRNYANTKDDGNAILDFMKLYVDLTMKANELSKDSSISNSKKNKYLNDFRLDQMKDFKSKADKGDLLSMLILLGMSESQTIPALGNIANSTVRGIGNFINPLAWFRKK